MTRAGRSSVTQCNSKVRPFNSCPARCLPGPDTHVELFPDGGPQMEGRDPDEAHWRLTGLQSP
eukprot:scaffold442451_cov39-Prasinocladus_malaysianus.AAC.1